MNALQIISASQVAIAAIVSFVCCCMILYRMFKAGEVALPVFCILSAFLGFSGVIIAFIVGWINVRKYDAMKIMVIWTIALVFLWDCFWQFLIGYHRLLQVIA